MSNHANPAASAVGSHRVGSWPRTPSTWPSPTSAPTQLHVPGQAQTLQQIASVYGSGARVSRPSAAAAGNWRPSAAADAANHTRPVSLAGRPSPVRAEPCSPWGPFAPGSSPGGCAVPTGPAAAQGLSWGMPTGACGPAAAGTAGRRPEPGGPARDWKPARAGHCGTAPSWPCEDAIDFDLGVRRHHRPGPAYRAKTRALVEIRATFGAGARVVER